MQQTGTTTAPADNSPRLSLYVAALRERQHRSVNLLMSMESNANYTWLLWQNGERVLLPRTLKYIEGQLPPKQFIRLRRNYTANIDYIVRAETNEYGRLVVRLQNGDQVEVARRLIVRVRRQLSLLLH